MYSVYIHIKMNLLCFFDKQKIPKKSGTGQELEKKLSDYEIGERLGKPSCNSAVYAAKTKSNGNEVWTYLIQYTLCFVVDH